jgi:hypothetical protein
MKAALILCSALAVVLIAPYAHIGDRPGGLAWAQDTDVWDNVCPSPSVSYCENVGKGAHNNSANPPPLRGIKVGRIIGVSWQTRGSRIPLPGAEESQLTYAAPKDEHYYIIDGGSENQFLRPCSQISGK